MYFYVTFFKRFCVVNQIWIKRTPAAWYRVFAGLPPAGRMMRVWSNRFNFSVKKGNIEGPVTGLDLQHPQYPIINTLHAFLYIGEVLSRFRPGKTGPGRPAR